MLSQQVSRLSMEMDAKKPELGTHCLAVARLVKAAAFTIEVPSKEMAAAAMLHDYGKILWPPALFAKVKSDLSHHDLEIISYHPQLGKRLVSMRWPECPETVLRLIERHHNPGGWFPAQLLAACDVWVACHEDRHYRTWPVPERIVLREMFRVAPEKAVKLVLDALRSNPMIANCHEELFLTTGGAATNVLTLWEHYKTAQ